MAFHTAHELGRRSVYVQVVICDNGTLLAGGEDSWDEGTAGMGAGSSSGGGGGIANASGNSSGGGIGSGAGGFSGGGGGGQEAGGRVPVQWDSAPMPSSPPQPYNNSSGNAGGPRGNGGTCEQSWPNQWISFPGVEVR